MVNQDKFKSGAKMKLTLIVCLSLFSINSFACREEAQFVATSVKPTFEDQKCIVKVFSFSHYVGSMLCPLYQEDVVEMGIVVKNVDEETCSKITKLSGYLVKDHFTHDIYLD